MAYRCVATSVAGFVQQLAVAYIANSYWFYVKGWIPERKDPARTDAKIITQYDLDVSKWTRARRRKAGAASVQYLRCGRFYVIVATHGEHPFYAAEGRQTSFEAIRFRHAGLLADEVVQASFRLLDFVPRVGELVNRFRSRELEPRESLEFARHALLLRYESVEAAPVEPETLLKPRRQEDEGRDLWRVTNCVQEVLERGGVSDWHKARVGGRRTAR
jgi:hypothetical protein